MKEIIYGSVCSGIEAATVAWHGLGWRPAFFAEIDPFASAVLAYHYPNVVNYGDFRNVPDEYRNAIDVMVAGTPCQSFSVAGKRGGLEDARGNLTLEFFNLVDRLRPRWVVWENVPGVFSQDGGRAFGSVLGKVEQLGYEFAWRTLDAQYFGVPQRRRRVFLVCHSGNLGRSASKSAVRNGSAIQRLPAAVLFERHSLSGDHPPSREAGKEVAGTLGGGAGKRGWVNDLDCSGAFIPTVDAITEQDYDEFVGHNCAGPCSCERCQRYARLIRTTAAFTPLTADGTDNSIWSKGSGGPAGDECQNLVADDPRVGIGIGGDGDPMYTLQAGHQHAIGSFQNTGQGWWNESDVATSVRTPEGSGSLEANVVTHSLRADGFDASEDGTGRGTPLIAFSAKDSGNDALEDISPTLRAGGHDQSHANAGVMPAIAFYSTGDTRDAISDCSPTLKVGSTLGIPSSPAIAFQESQSGTRLRDTHATLDANNGSRRMEGVVSAFTQNQCGDVLSGDVMHSLGTNANATGRNAANVANQMTVRRLTPIEVERLQGFPDNYTLVPYRGKLSSDGPRYKVIGNSFAVPVVRWIGKRIQEMEDWLGEQLSEDAG